jgi:hypothetical protein
MWPYWIMFLVPAVAAFTERQSVPVGRVPQTWRQESVGWILAIIVLTLVVGWRYQVGGDWQNYLDSLFDAQQRSLQDSLSIGDPGYRLLEWIASEMGLGIASVNLIGGLLFCYGLVRFCKSLPRPWLALAVATPYLLIIVGMGYTRQGIALGCAMVGLVALGRQRMTAFFVWTFIGATFHKSAVLLIPLAALASTKHRLWTLFWAAVFTAGAYVLMLDRWVDSLQAGYVDAEYQSEGALVRLLMNAVPAVVLLILRKRFSMPRAQKQLWLWFALISLALCGVYFVSPSSTAVDRVALYMIPLQLVVFAYLPDGLRRSGWHQQVTVAAVVAYYAAVQFVWLNFALNASYWVPYQFYPFAVWL